MLGDISIADSIYIICGYTDMRRSIDGLCDIVKEQLDIQPENTSSLFLFCGRKCDRIKALLHEKDGFVLLYKRLDHGLGRYRWPRNKIEARKITWRQLEWLLQGLEIDQKNAIKIA